MTTGSVRDDPRERRRLVAVMFIDLVGFTGLMSRDESGARDVRRRLLSVVSDEAAKSGGEMVQTLGDGALLVFDSAVEACDCALAVQERLTTEPSPIAARIGIHQGDVVFAEGNVVGDAVNLASRLEGVCAPGQICVSSSIREELANKPEVTTESIGTFTLKNVPSPTEAFRVRRSGEADDVEEPTRVAGVGGDVRSRGQRASSAVRGRWVGGAIVALVLVAGIATWNGGGFTLGSTEIRSVAVLPLLDLSEQGELRHFGDGMAEELIHALAQVPDLDVTARTSSFAFRDRELDVGRIGRSLDVDAIVEGSVRGEEPQLRVTIQLVRTSDGFHVWSHNFDREMGRTLEIQTEIADSVASLIGLQKPVRTRAAGSDTSPDAVIAYMRGVAARADGAGLETAARWFEEALAVDPDLAEAKVALGDVLLELALTTSSPEEADRYLEEARAFVDQAVRDGAEPLRADVTLALIEIAEGSRPSQATVRRILSAPGGRTELRWWADRAATLPGGARLRQEISTLLETPSP